MTSPSPFFRLQAGSMILEALIAILVFSMGILAIVGLQAAAIRTSTDAKYRSDASLLANELIGQMWVSDRTPATLQAAFSSPDGAAYQKWAWAGVTSGTKTAAAQGSVLSVLPVAQADLPTVAVSGANVVTVTVYWKAPGDLTRHNHVVVAQIGG